MLQYVLSGRSTQTDNCHCSASCLTQASGYLEFLGPSKSAPWLNQGIWQCQIIRMPLYQSVHIPTNDTAVSINFPVYRETQGSTCQLQFIGNMFMFKMWKNCKLLPVGGIDWDSICIFYFLRKDCHSSLLVKCVWTKAAKSNASNNQKWPFVDTNCISFLLIV